MSENPYPPGERQSFSGDGRPATVVPHNREAEEAVLGAVLVSPETYFELVHNLLPDDFFLHRNRWIWEAFTSLQEQRLPIDVLTVSEELERQDRLQEIGGPAYLATLIHNVPERRRLCLAGSGKRHPAQAVGGG
jgi:replicative DNA helicase